MKWFNTGCKKFVVVLNQQIFVLIKARRSQIPLGIKASTQRRGREKDVFKMVDNLLHRVLHLLKLNS